MVLHDIKDLCEDAELDSTASRADLPKAEYSGLEVHMPSFCRETAINAFDFQLDPRRLSAQENALINRLQLELISQRLINAIIRSLPYFPEYVLSSLCLSPPKSSFKLKLIMHILGT